jgi:sigma54-dependent transcription regulator
MTGVQRYQMNSNVKYVLVRHAADLSKLQFSFSGKVLYIYGLLAKDPAGEMNKKEVSAMVDELARIPRLQAIQFDLSNWNIASTLESWDISKKTPMGPATSDRGLVLHLPDGTITKDDAKNQVLDDEDPEEWSANYKKGK